MSDRDEPPSKVCSRCKAEKPTSQFNFRARATRIRHSYCRDCGKELTRSHYRRNKRAYLDRNTRTYARHRELVRSAKSRPCADCGIQYPYYVMDFDHREGAGKSFILSEAQRATSKSLLLEINKCDVVCANCHRERTHRRMMSKRSDKLD